MSVRSFKLVFIYLISISLLTQAYAGTRSIPADTAIVIVKSKDTVNYPVRLMYTENNEAKFVLIAKAGKRGYEFHIPAKGYSKAILYISSVNSIIKTGQSFIPQPAPQFLIKGGKEVSITANFNNPLDMSLMSEDREIMLYERFSARERQSHLLTWTQMKIKFATPVQQEKVHQAENEIARLSRELNAYKKEFVTRNRSTFPALLVFESYYTELSNEQALEQLKTIAAGYKDSPIRKALYAKLDAANATGKGAVIPEFRVQDLHGKTFNSRELGGRYLLIDFWGSWCQPCRASHPELKEIYERYKSKGLEILGIAYESGSLENQMKQWKKAIEEDQINWIHVLNSPQNNLVKLFGISSYPTKILVDPKGNILFRTNGSGADLKKQLVSIFDQKNPALASLDKNISRDSLFNYLNQKLAENTTASVAILKAEADALRKSTDEDRLLLAAKLYKVMGNDADMQLVEKDVLRQFPKGILARDQALDQVFGSKPEHSVEVVEKDYLDWLKAYPPSNYSLKQRDKYDFALLSLIQLFSKANNKVKVDDYLGRFSGTNLKAIALFNTGKDFMTRNETPRAINYMVEALKLSREAKESPDPKIRKSLSALYYAPIVNDYAAALLVNGQAEESARLAADQLAVNNYTGMGSQTLVITLAKALDRNGEQSKAFQALDKYLRANPQSPDVLMLARELYLKLHGNTADFQQYLNQLISDKQKDQAAHLKNTMISEKAPLFSLYNRKGELVNLADYKGKVLVLDFWATWCVPCKQSFPGMQAVLDKYKDNKDVEFLFIDTWETKPGFEKEVNELMDKNKYTFNVLYDKQKDKNEEAVVKKYGVSAIPAKFIIDKAGDIRFRVSNSPTDKESILNELSAMIDMVLK